MPAQAKCGRLVPRLDGVSSKTPEHDLISSLALGSHITIFINFLSFVFSISSLVRRQPVTFHMGMIIMEAHERF